jgi:hypothetical protein
MQIKHLYDIYMIQFLRNILIQLNVSVSIKYTVKDIFFSILNKMSF